MTRNRSIFAVVALLLALAATPVRGGTGIIWQTSGAALVEDLNIYDSDVQNVTREYDGSLVVGTNGWTLRSFHASLPSDSFFFLKELRILLHDPLPYAGVMVYLTRTSKSTGQVSFLGYLNTVGFDFRRTGPYVHRIPLYYHPLDSINYFYHVRVVFSDNLGNWGGDLILYGLELEAY